MNKQLYVESTKSLEQLAVIMAIYSNWRFRHPEVICIELRTRREKLKNALSKSKATEHMPCGYQDSAYETLLHSIKSFHAFVDAMRLMKGCVPRRMISLVSETVGG